MKFDDERLDNGYVTLTEQGQSHVKEFALTYGKNAENWNMNALYTEVEESLNNSSLGESMSYELRSSESNNGRPNIFNPELGDVEYRSE